MFKKLKQVLSFTMMLVFLLNLVPVKELKAFASTPGSVTIISTYEAFNLVSRRVIVTDDKIRLFTNKELYVFTSTALEALTNIANIGQTTIQGNIPNNIGPFSQVWVLGSEGNELKYLNVNEGNIPEITSVETSIVTGSDGIVVNGFNTLRTIAGDYATSQYKVTVGGVESDVEVIRDNQVRIKPAPGKQFKQGLNEIAITFRATRKDSEGVDYTLETRAVYKDAVRIIRELNLEGITMFPNMGEVGSEIKFSRNTLGNYDVYFIRDLDSPSLFTEANRAKFYEWVSRQNANDTVTVKVPNISAGPYHIVFTNPNSQTLGVLESYIIPNQQFRVITITQKPIIYSVMPDSTPSLTEQEVDIYGQFFTKHNITGFTPQFPMQVTHNSGTGELSINYGTGVLELGGITYNVKVTRKFEIMIGQLLPVIGYDFTDEDGVQRIRVRTIPIALEQIEQSDVIVRMTTHIEPATPETTPKFNGDMVNDIVRLKGFTYFPATEPPNITSVTPGFVPIEQVGTGADVKYYINETLDELYLAIHGSRFLVTRYVENGLEIQNFPRIILGGAEINSSVLSYQVFNNGVLVDGTVNNDIGNMILLRFKAGKEGFQILNKDSREITIRNPIRRSKQHADPRTFENRIEFILVPQNNFPVIENVQPNLVAIEGGEDVVITGSNLRTGAQVFIENRLVTGVVVSGDNTRITFKAPRGLRAGETQLQVVNPDKGGIATFPFIYTTTYTQPKLTLINPTEGTTGTIVTVKGENLLRPDPTVTVTDINDIGGAEIYRLMGTRILLDGQDINRYNRVGNHIRLTPYVQGTGRVLKDDVFVYRENINEIELGQGFSSTILYENNLKKFYIITRNNRNQYIIQDGVGSQYVIQHNGNFRAVKDGTVYDIHFDAKGIIRLSRGGEDHITLRAYTPYEIEEKGGFSVVTGNRVQFVDSKTLTFTVPDLTKSPWTGDGLYDVSVINPDTKRQTLTKVFRYFSDPRIIPVVEDVSPFMGPESGGNIITITSPNDGDSRTGFVDTGTSKTRVFIGSQRVPDSHVIISPNRREMTVIVPKYIENIKDQGTDRITVPIVLVNPDGGSFSIHNDKPLIVQRGGVPTAIRGYIYVVPTSNPRIIDFFPKSGPVTGGNIVEIFGEDFRDYDIPGSTEKILPEVYFGNRRAVLVRDAFTPTGYIQVIAPPGKGTVDLYVINNDSGMSNKVKYTYRESRPTIRSVSPTFGSRIGGDRVDIVGSDFETGQVVILKPTTNGNLSLVDLRNMPMVKVANRTNKDLPREHDNSGVLRSSRATVTLDGGFTFRYNAGEGSLVVELLDRGKTYKATYNGVADVPVFINTKDFKTEQEEGYPYEELIRVYVENNRFIVDAGYAPDVDFRGATLITATMPYYYTIGRVDLYVINPDGGQARANFEFKNPDSRPQITDVLRDGRSPETVTRTGYGTVRVATVNFKGGNVIEVLGNDFREGAIIQIGNVLTINSQNMNLAPNQIVFTMPSVPQSLVGTLQRVTVLNSDGGVTSSDRLSPPIYIEFIQGESSPALNKITPDRGPASGGTRVTIEGSDFRRTMDGFDGGTLSVLFGGSRVEFSENTDDIIFESYRKIHVKVPASTRIGTVDVRVENPDGELSNPVGKFTYISKPIVTGVNPNVLFRNDTITEVTISGQMFMPGAKVVVGGSLIDPKAANTLPVRGTGITGVDNTGKNIERSVVGGVEPAQVTVVDANTIVVRFNEAKEKLDNTNIIIINPDGGISDPYAGFRYEIPVPTRPLVIEAIPGYESTMKLMWSKSPAEVLNASDRFEIYARTSNQTSFTYVGETKAHEFLIRGLTPDTLYTFRVRALNAYGGAVEFAEATARTLTIQQDLLLKEKQEKIDTENQQLNQFGREEIIGDTVVKTIGINELGTSTRDYVIPFNLPKYDKHNKYTIAIPVSVVRSNQRNIRVTDGQFDFTFRPSGLNIRQVLEVPQRDMQDAYVRVNIHRLTGAQSSDILTAVQRTQVQASQVYVISFELQVGRNVNTINPTNLGGQVQFIFDSRAYPRANASQLFVAGYSPSQHRFNSINSGSSTRINSGGTYILLSNR